MIPFWPFGLSFGPSAFFDKKRIENMNPNGANMTPQMTPKCMQNQFLIWDHVLVYQNSVPKLLTLAFEGGIRHQELV